MPEEASAEAYVIQNTGAGTGSAETDLAAYADSSGDESVDALILTGEPKKLPRRTRRTRARRRSGVTAFLPSSSRYWAAVSSSSAEETKAKTNAQQPVKKSTRRFAPSLLVPPDNELAQKDAGAFLVGGRGVGKKNVQERIRIWGFVGQRICNPVVIAHRATNSLLSLYTSEFSNAMTSFCKSMAVDCCLLFSRKLFFL